MRIGLFLWLVMLPPLATANSFEEFKKDYQAQKQEFLDARQTQYETFRKAYLAEYDKFRAELLDKWAVPIQTSTESEVIYTNDQQTRLILNEADQTLTIETLVDETLPELTASTLLTDKLAANLLSNINMADADLNRQLEQQTPVIVSQTTNTSRQVLIQQITEQSEKVLSAVDTNTNLTDQAKVQKRAQVQQEKAERVETLDKQLKLVSKADPTYKRVQSYTVKLPGNYLRDKISPFITHYQQEANRTNNELALLLAISHAESSFDPKAKSHIPAFGLMQIVPSSAGMDVATKVLKKSQAPSANELYQPQTNILYGSSYLNILSTQYLKRIEDPLSRKFCTIAAYNTGAGNVARAFNKDNSRSIVKAAPIINSMSSEEVYQRLLTHLPYDETKKYLKKVRKLNDQYMAEVETSRL